MNGNRNETDPKPGGAAHGKPYVDPDQDVINERLSKVKHRIVVLSGKGGVGKSTVATNLAAALAKKGAKVGLMDVDIHGPSIPKMVGLSGRRVEGDQNGILPIEAAENLKVVSIEFFLQSGDDAVIWRGPLKMNVIKQFIKDVMWGELDYLVVDCPPGTGDEPLSVAQLMGTGTNAIIVTTPQEVAVQAVRRSVTFSRQVGMHVLGLIENMSGYLCPHCGETSNPFGAEGGKRLADDMGVKFLGSIPLSPEVVPAGDAGKPLALEAESAIGKIYNGIAEEITSILAE